MRTPFAKTLNFAVGPMLIGMALIGFTLSGCSGGDNSSAGGATPKTAGDTSGKKKLKIAVIPKGSTHAYWKTLHEGVNKAAKEFDLDIVFEGPQKEDDRDSQISTVQGKVQDKVDGIVLAPLDDKALVPSVKEANDANIPVVIIDSSLRDGAKYVSFVATDNEKAGALAGDAMAKALGGKGKIIVLRYEEGSASTTDREKGFIDAAKKGGLTIVSDNQYAHATVETAITASENLLSGFKAGDGLSIDGIFCPNESSAQGMLRALEDSKLAGKVKFFGFDSSDQLLKGLDDGKIDGLVVQNPRNMGYLSVKTLVQSIKGEKVETRIDTGATLITKANKDTPENKALLAPPAL
jgi:ribose transport system substrate-binding protein